MGNLQMSPVIQCKYRIEMMNTVNGPNIKICSRNLNIDPQNMNINGLNIECLNIDIDIYLGKYNKLLFFGESVDIPLEHM